MKMLVSKIKMIFLKNQLDSISKNETNDILWKRVEELTNALSKFIQGKENLDKLLATQRYGFNKNRFRI